MVSRVMKILNNARNLNEKEENNTAFRQQLFKIEKRKFRLKRKVQNYYVTGTFNY